MLQIERVSKLYRKAESVIPALDQAWIGVNAGEFVVVHGPSGSGKTTLLLSAGGLLAPDDGQVLVHGRDPYRLPREKRARLRAEMIGFVFQQFHLIPYLTVRENVLAPSLALPAGDARERGEELIEHFNLSARAAHMPSELSTGERQRTALARALLNRPRLLLADEPTGNLDPENASVVLTYIAEFARTGGAVLMVTHNELAAACADRIVQMREGRLLHRATQQQASQETVDK